MNDLKVLTRFKHKTFIDVQEYYVAKISEVVKFVCFFEPCCFGVCIPVDYRHLNNN